MAQFFCEFRWRLAVACGVLAASTVLADTTLDAATLALRSGGTVTAGTRVTLSANGYLGTYVRLDQAGPLSLTVNASGDVSNGVASNLTVSVADYSQSFSVGSTTAAGYSFTTPRLPAGTYFVRTQLDNHKTVLVNGAPVVANTSLSIRNLTVAGSATVRNTSSDANAVAAANTYINSFRKGDATVKVNGVTPGTVVRVQLRSNAFKLGTYASGYSADNNFLMADPAAGSDAANFQAYIRGRFNSVVPSNAGKWSSNEATPDNVNMGAVDSMLTFATNNGMSARMHNLIWGNQQPNFVRTLVTDAASGSATAAASRAQLNAAITKRIQYYVNGTTDGTGNKRAVDYVDLDVLNEALLTGPYFEALGYDGIANIHKQTQDAVAAAGAKTRLFTNEYNVLQNSPTTVTPSADYNKQAAATYGDQYANWYREQVEGINNAGRAAGAKGDVVTGVGFQYYPLPGTPDSLGPSVIQKAVQNLAVTGLPMSLTEFGAQPAVTQTEAPQIVDDAMRMMLGTPGVESFLYWGWYDMGPTNMFGGGSELIENGWKNADGSWKLTPTGVRFEYLFGRGLDPTAPGANPDGSNPHPWTTDLTLPVGPDGTIQFNGFYGDYTLVIDGKGYDLSLVKGANNATLSITVPEPARAAAVGLSILAGLRRQTR